MKITLIDNYDSFTYNLVQYFGELGVACDVYRNDALTAEDVMAGGPAAIVISPGPCDPDQAGICLELIRLAADKDIPLLGVCLGHQAIAQAFGGRVVRADVPMHGKLSAITHSNDSVFADLPSPLTVTRYHSLVAAADSLPDDLTITARAEDDTIMALSHKSKPVHGVQFHPESIATEYGHKILKNFIEGAA